MERRLQWPLLAAALLTIPAIVIEQSNVGEPFDTTAIVLNWTIWTAFLIEIGLMLSVVDDRWRWLRDHPLDVAIVVLTPPFLPATLQATRIFRLLRLVRLMKLAVLSRRLLSTEGVRDASCVRAHHDPRGRGRVRRGRARPPRRDRSPRGTGCGGRSRP